MDQKELQQKIALYYSKLSPDAQKAFSEMKWLETLKQLSEKYGLREDQIQTLGTETTLLLLGIIHPVEYEETLTGMGLRLSVADKMFSEVEELIVRPVRPQILLAFEANQKTEDKKGSTIEPKLDNRFDKLPESIREIIRASNYEESLFNISRKHGLNIELMGILDEIVTELITGVISANTLESSIMSKLKVTSLKTREIVNDIKSEIFLPIREKMMAIGDNRKVPQQEDAQVLTSAGIEIISEEAESAEQKKYTANTTFPIKQEALSEKREEILEKIEKPVPAGNIHPDQPTVKVTHPILAQKLNGYTKNEVIETEHSLDKISRDKSGLHSQAEDFPKTGYDIDPYRMRPE